MIFGGTRQQQTAHWGMQLMNRLETIKNPKAACLFNVTVSVTCRQFCVHSQFIFILLGGIALAQAIPPIATHFSVAWSVYLSSVCLSVCLLHSCILLKPFDGFRCHLAGTLVGSNDTFRRPPKERRDLGVKPQSPGGTCSWTLHAATWQIETRSDCAFCQITLVLILLYLIADVRVSALTVDFDGDLSLVVVSPVVELSAARVFAVVRRRDVADTQSTVLHELIPTAHYNNQSTTTTTSPHYTVSPKTVPVLFFE